MILFDKYERERQVKLLAFLKSRYLYDEEQGGFVGHPSEKELREASDAQISRGSRGKLIGKTADLVWLWHHGELPPSKMLHKDGFWWNNRIDNLGMVLCDGHVEGCGDEWHIRSVKKQMVTFHSTHRTWREAVAAYECRDLV